MALKKREIAKAFKDGKSRSATARAFRVRIGEVDRILRFFLKISTL
jgi:hypothetical protein